MNYSIDWDGPGERDKDSSVMDRLAIIAMVTQMKDEYRTSDEIVDAVINALTPEDGEECPVCGISP
jgi:hypothetical protein